jgi:hypothetical protein
LPILRGETESNAVAATTKKMTSQDGSPTGLETTSAVIVTERPRIEVALNEVGSYLTRMGLSRTRESVERQLEPIPRTVRSWGACSPRAVSVEAAESTPAFPSRARLRTPSSTFRRR